MAKNSCALPNSSPEEVKTIDVGLIGVEELDVLIRSLTAIVKLAQRTKRKLENADLRNGLSKRNDL